MNVFDECCNGYGDRCPVNWDCPLAPPDRRETSDIDRLLNAKTPNQQEVVVEGAMRGYKLGLLGFLKYLVGRGKLGGPNDGEADTTYLHSSGEV